MDVHAAWMSKMVPLKGQLISEWAEMSLFMA